VATVAVDSMALHPDNKCVHPFTEPYAPAHTNTGSVTNIFAITSALHM
jgi:hypothetical protein